MPPSISAQRPGGGEVDHLLEQLAAARRRLRPRRPRRSLDAGEAHERRAPVVDAGLGHDLEAARALRHEEERDAARRRPRRPRVRAATTQRVGGGRVQHLDLLAARAASRRPPAPRASRRGAGRSGCAASWWARARMRSPATTPGSHCSRCASLPPRTSARPASSTVAEERLGREVAAERLEHHGEVREAEARAARPPPGTGCRPSRARPSPSRAPSRSRADRFASRSARKRATGELLRREVGGGLRDQLLVFAEDELHGRSP